MKLTFSYTSFAGVCPRKLGGYVANTSIFTDEDGGDNGVTTLEVEDMDIPTLLATLASDMVDWDDYISFRKVDEFKEHINSIVKHYCNHIDDYIYDCDDWDDYFILLLMVQEYLRMGKITDSMMFYYCELEEDYD
jgi:cytochrome oxidase Cu insertion factor (SCO1/SenC/PrrC family)